MVFIVFPAQNVGDIERTSETKQHQMRCDAKHQVTRHANSIKKLQKKKSRTSGKNSDNYAYIA